ncbi:hypothetical protein [Microlunatus soli]|uniref:Uncharacterized protein n=1 Tax=Microlunatus soli TaxID=630515 RepID=A0A1H1N5C7_9ACTN|nr:hypothetical protein [Microlunatus soli]SDR94080.1 hypothetical protein SAMN04489812_0385 [Microlunatus soli]
MLIEFQGSVLVMLGAHLLGRSWIHPARVNAATHRRGYLRGPARLGLLRSPALVLFAVGHL